MDIGNPLDPKILTPESNDRDSDSVLGAIDTIYRSWNEKDERDNKNRLIQELLEQGFEVQDPTGTRKIDGYVLQQAMWRTANRMKPLDFQIHASGRPEAQEKIVTFGVGQVMEDGGYLRALRDKGGGFQYLLAFGDAFIRVGTSDKDESPIEFSPIANTNVYVDPYAISMRNGSPGRNVTKMVVVESMSYGQMLELYPEAKKKKAGAGKIPRDINYTKETGRSYLQTEQENKDYTEVAHYYDIANKVYCVFVGAACTIIKELKGDKYPFIKDKKPYIPVLHFMCWPSLEGFWNHGIGDMLYKLTILTRRLMNMAIGQVEDNTYPITLVNVPNEQVSKFFNKLLAAHEMRAAGKKGYVAMEYDPNAPTANRVQADQLTTQGLFNEWAMVYDRLDREIQRLGINLNDIEAGSNVTATQIMLEEESSNALVKQIMEYNASESKFAVELTLDFIEKFVKKSNKTLVDLPTRIKVDGQEVQVDAITLGAIGDEVRAHDYFVRINARTGAIPSNVMQQAQISRLLAGTQPGTPAYVKLMEQLAQLNDRDLTQEDFGAPQAGEPEEMGDKPIPSETDRVSINARLDEPEPAF